MAPIVALLMVSGECFCESFNSWWLAVLSTDVLEHAAWIAQSNDMLELSKHKRVSNV